MAVNVVRFSHRGQARWGVVDAGRVRTVRGSFPTTRDFMLAGAPKARAGDVDRETFALADVTVLCPITPDRQFICQAVNYYSHLRESGMSPKTNPFNIFFRKASSCLSPADTDVVCPAHVEFLDYEVELGLVLSSDVSAAVEVSESNVADFVGAFVLNDVSARDVQLPQMQFYKGKSYRTFGPAGPYLTLVDREDLGHFDRLHLKLSVNGEVRQDSYAKEMVHKPAATLTELSGVQNWEAGDLLATGTPGGCALQAPPAPIRALSRLMSPARLQSVLRASAARNSRRLKAGDTMEASIRTDDGRIDLGIQRNRITDGERS